MSSTPDAPEPEPHEQNPATQPPVPPTPLPQPGQPGPMGYAPGPWQAAPPPPRKGLSFGAGLGIGIAIGVVAHALGIGAMFLGISIAGGGTPLVFLWPFILIALAAAVMMFFAKTRPFATGILIIAASMWLLIIGPCILILTGL